MNIKIETYSCNWETYKKVVNDIISKLSKCENFDIKQLNITYNISQLEGTTIQAQRSPMCQDLINVLT